MRIRIFLERKWLNWVNLNKYYFFLLPTYNIADIIDETASTPNANLKANK